jgi:predicted metalloprotease with PDZ domain
MRHFYFGVFIFVLFGCQTNVRGGEPIQYALVLSNPKSHNYQVRLKLPASSKDTLKLVMPAWTPGYYQLMDYASSVSEFLAVDENGDEVQFENNQSNVWTLVGTRYQSIFVTYTINTNRQFVANSYVDSTHAYIIGANSFVYPEGQINSPIRLKIETPKGWNIATGLQVDAIQSNLFFAKDFDVLYDCPLLIGQLEELNSFDVRGVKHRFLGIDLGEFDRPIFMKNIEKMVNAAVEIFDDVPYDQYSFIAIGPGRGGIEHLNNTTISFDGNGLDQPENMNRTMNFLTHEYFHHFNVKRIRPFELGPFDYEHGSRTNLLWLSEGLTVYYEYLIMKRAGLIDHETLIENFEDEITTLQNNPGRKFQSLQQASYGTWHDGPFGEHEAGKSVSIYNKGAVVGLIIDLAIRHATNNQQSLDDAMKLIYQRYNIELQRGITDAEFQQICEEVAGISLTEVFEYVSTTNEINYEKYLGYAGLIIRTTESDQSKKYLIKSFESLTDEQSKIRQSLFGF